MAKYDANSLVYNQGLVRGREAISLFAYELVDGQSLLKDALNTAQPDHIMY